VDGDGRRYRDRWDNRVVLALMEPWRFDFNAALISPLTLFSVFKCVFCFFR
jgi:hypothetical protein